MALAQKLRFVTLLLFFFSVVMSSHTAVSQTNSSIVKGTVTDSGGALVAGATVVLLNPVSGYNRTTTTDQSGTYEFFNVPFDTYSLLVTAKGFGDNHTDLNVISSVPVTTSVRLRPEANQTVSVTAEAQGPLSEHRRHTIRTSTARPLTGFRSRARPAR